MNYSESFSEEKGFAKKAAADHGAKNAVDIGEIMRGDTDSLKIDALTKAKWKRMLDLTAQMTECQAAFIVRATQNGAEVLVRGSFGAAADDDLQADAIMLCRTVMAEGKELVIANAEKENRCKEIGKASAFLGYPLFWPQKNVFGVICVIDAHERSFWNWSRELLAQHAESISDELEAQNNKQLLEALNSEHLCGSKVQNGQDECFSKIFNLSPAAIVITAIGDGRIIDANQSYFKLFGFTRKELIGKTGIQLCIFDDPNVRRAISHRLGNGEPVRDYETTLMTKSGETRQVLISVDKTDFCGEPSLISTIYDLSSIIDLKQKLRTINERFSLAARAADMGIWDWNIIEDVIVWDDQMLRLLGIKRKAFSGALAGWLAIIHADDRDTVESKLRKALSGEEEFICEYRTLKPNDEVRYMRTYGNTVHDEQGLPLRMTGVMFDVTDRRNAQMQIRESEERYRSLFHNNNAVQLILDSETGGIIDANSAACAFYGLTSNMMRKIKLWDIDDAGEQMLRERIAQAYAKGADSLDALHKRHDGQLRDMEIFCGRVVMNGQKLLHMIIHDVTERKRTERGLIESENRFRLFVESAPDGVFVEMDGLFAYVNQMALQLFGVENEQKLLGKPVQAFFSKTSRKSISASMRQLNVYKKPLPVVKETIDRADQTQIEVEVSAVPFQLGGEDGALVFLHDISVRRQLEIEKINIEAQLRQKQKLESIGILAGGVAHEINNPVSGIINYAQLIAETPNISDEVAEFGSEIIREGNRIAGIVKNLLKFARQEKQTHSLANVNDIINDTLSLIRTIIRKDKIVLEVELEDALPEIKCRSQQIQQVLMNLITNARDALNARYKNEHEDKKIRLSSTQIDNGSGKWVQIVVEDKGMGIPDDIKDKLFDPFFTTKARDEGTGLGLSISHGIVSDHKGLLFLESEWGQYTRAVLELPVNNGWALTADAEG